jgi:Zn-dependent M16 (insulinase) family peptidase
MIERLRDRYSTRSHSQELRDEAADEIERLTDEVSRLRQLLVQCTASVEFDDERVRYVTVQIGRDVFNEARDSGRHDP